MTAELETATLAGGCFWCIEAAFKELPGVESATSGYAGGETDDPIVTEIEPLETFYEAEPNHQDYYEKNPGDAYCQFNAQPKVEKVREKFAGGVETSQ